MDLTAAVITVSDKGSRGEREDRSGRALAELLEADGWRVVRTEIVPDERDRIERALIESADEVRAALIVTTGGTGFSPRDVTPEATRAVIERETPGIPEAMRAESLRMTPRGCLSRGAAGIRGESLIINVPGSEKAARECISAVLPALEHGVETLRGAAAECGAHVVAVCISEAKGTQKHFVESAELIVEHGIEGDAHAGKWHRQVSLLASESVDVMRPRVDFELKPGDFAENILTQGIELRTLPIGTRLRVGSAELEITQIGKECHSDCAIRRAAGDCVMPREGVFARVLAAGTVKAGDPVELIR